MIFMWDLEKTWSRQTKKIMYSEMLYILAYLLTSYLALGLEIELGKYVHMKIER